MDTYTHNHTHVWMGVHTHTHTHTRCTLGQLPLLKNLLKTTTLRHNVTNQCAAFLGLIHYENHNGMEINCVWLYFMTLHIVLWRIILWLSWLEILLFLSAKCNFGEIVLGPLILVPGGVAGVINSTGSDKTHCGRLQEQTEQAVLRDSANTFLQHVWNRMDVLTKVSISLSGRHMKKAVCLELQLGN